jgi:hypothetical protein
MEKGAEAAQEPPKPVTQWDTVRGYVSDGLWAVGTAVFILGFPLYCALHM